MRESLGEQRETRENEPEATAMEDRSTRHSRLLIAMYGALALLPLVVTPYTWLAFLRLPPAGSGLTGCLLEEYCHYGPADIIHAQLPGITYIVLPLVLLPYFAASRRRDVRLALLAVLLGVLRFGVPLAIWLVGTRAETATGMLALLNNCAPEQTCEFQPGLTYYFLTPLEALSGLASLVLYVLTVTLWLHIREPARRRPVSDLAFDHP